MTKFCSKCNQPNPANATFCSNCASPLSAGGPVIGGAGNIGGSGAPQSGEKSNRALISLILAIAALVCCGPFTGIPAAIIGWMELSAINSGQSSPDGRMMAMGGLWVGIIASVLQTIMWFVFLIFSAAAGGGGY